MDWLVRRSTQPVIVVEAIKLLELTLAGGCDSIWVTYTPPEIQLTRLMVNRKMSEAEARQRIAAQPPQEQKLAAANVVIRNDSSFEEAWRQVNALLEAGGPQRHRRRPGCRHPPAASHAAGRTIS